MSDIHIDRLAVIEARNATAPSDAEVDANLRLVLDISPSERYPEYGHDSLRDAYRAAWDLDYARIDVPRIAAALRAVLALKTARVSSEMQDYDIDQAEGWNDALATVRIVITETLEGSS